MISVLKAIEIVKSSQIYTATIDVKLIDSLNTYCAEDIFAPIDMPPFSQSAMDGYAICGTGKTFKVVGEIKAGDVHSKSIKQGEAYRIFTGAMIPNGTTAIAKQEIVERKENIITLQETVNLGMSIRRQGEEIKKNQLIIEKGTKLTPAIIGFLSGLGLINIPIRQKPKVAVIVTGNELTKVGEPLKKGKIYESNSYTLKAALNDIGISSSVFFVKDDFNATKQAILNAIKHHQMVILSGGISVGDYDFVGKALLDIGVKQKFYKVKQKPGKPLFYGEIDQTKIFGLPGNPAAALTSFYVYVLTAIKVMMGANQPELLNIKAKMAHDYTKKGDRAQFLKAQINGNEVKVHSGQSSAMLSSFANANALVFLDEKDYQITKGQEVNVLMLN
jgi:molybdopterin molybdotransferase